MRAGEGLTTACMVDRANRRLVVKGYPDGRSPEFWVDEWLKTAAKYDLEKIWLWAFPEDVPVFFARGFALEGWLDDGRAGRRSASMAYYLKAARGISRKLAAEDELLQAVTQKPTGALPALPEGLSARSLDLRDNEEIAAILGEVFSTYPNPVSETDYIKGLLRQGCLFEGVFSGQTLVSVAAAYPDVAMGCCEMTDCATRPKFRGLALTERLLKRLGRRRELEDLTLYTLARAGSYGVNRVFHKLGYRFRGRLINNCDIDGGFEDMNLLVR